MSEITNIPSIFGFFLLSSLATYGAIGITCGTAAEVFVTGTFTVWVERSAIGITCGLATEICVTGTFTVRAESSAILFCNRSLRS